MTPARLAVASALVVALVLATAWLLELPLAQAVVLAPVIVATVGATVFIFLLWTKVVVELLRGRRSPD